MHFVSSIGREPDQSKRGEPSPVRGTARHWCDFALTRLFTSAISSASINYFRKTGERRPTMRGAFFRPGKGQTHEARVGALLVRTEHLVLGLRAIRGCES